jgi:hypothetical protein
MRNEFFVSLDCRTGDIRRYARIPGNRLRTLEHVAFDEWDVNRNKEGAAYETIQQFRKYGPRGIGC